jgi:glycosyltransferase involved in cell wall biosynthesis
MIEGLLVLGIVPLVILPKCGSLGSELGKRAIPYAHVSYFLSIYPPLQNARDLLLFLPRLFRTLWVNRRAAKRLIDLVHAFKPAIIHSNVGPLQIGHMVARKCDKPHVWHLREFQEFRLCMYPLFSMSGFLRKLHSLNTHPIANSRGTYDCYSLGVNGRVIYNGFDKANRPQFAASKKRYFLYAGRLEKNKGIRELIIAFAEFAKTESRYQLYVAGDTLNKRFKKSLLSLVKDFQMNDKVIFLGMLDDIDDLMAQATALIVPSVKEGFGRTTVEAMFNGCLVIGNNSGGTKEILAKEDLGILYSGHDELVAAMKMIAADGIERHFPMITKARARAVALYSVEQNVSAVFDFYREIMANRTI